ncbi:MAG: PRC-barrel domain containing protein [Rhodopirellula sp. JB055]|uniref:PRC-barrel domain containing protein n=1 Tax=Rhodopirellula sp. JB055 TaxID=3342846 RepID=UPI00370ACF8A
MMISTEAVMGTELMGTDQSVGAICDLLFDDETWVVRHLVVDTGHWLPGRQVLLPPIKVQNADWNAASASVPLTRREVKESPSVESDRPVSRQMEIELYQHFDVPYYWGPAGATLAGSGYTPMPLAAGLMPMDQVENDDIQRNHLRSIKEVSGYTIQGTDDHVGHVHGLVVDDVNWSIQQLIVDTGNWWPGKKVLIGRGHIREISWSDGTVTVGLTQDEIKRSPLYEPVV